MAYKKFICSNYEGLHAAISDLRADCQTRIDELRKQIQEHEEKIIVLDSITSKLTAIIED